MNNTRLVKWWAYETHKTRDGKNICKKVNKDDAVFHYFTTESQEDNSVPVAVIELQDGTVKSVPVKHIQFLDKEEETKTPKILEKALRQYQHNNCSGFVTGFDYEETIKTFNIMEKILKAQSNILLAYQANEIPPKWTTDVILQGRNYGLEF